MIGRWSLSILCALLAWASAAHAMESAVARPNPAAPGDIVVIEPSHLPSRATFNLSFLRFDSRSGKPRALAGIDVASGPGHRDIVLRWTYAPPVEIHLAVKEKKFPVEPAAAPAAQVPSQEKNRVWNEREHLEILFRDVSREPLWSGPFRRPVEGPVAVRFGVRRIAGGKVEDPFPAVEIRAAAGTPVRASNRGRVVLAQDLYDTGKTVVLDHGFGLYTIYGHLRDITVRKGTLVKTGETIGHVGSAGNVLGPSLYWAARLTQARVDPFQLLKLEGGQRRDGGRGRAQSRN